MTAALDEMVRGGLLQGNHLSRDQLEVRDQDKLLTFETAKCTVSDGRAFREEHAANALSRQSLARTPIARRSMGPE